MNYRRFLPPLLIVCGLALLLWFAYVFEELRLTRSMQTQLSGKAEELDRQLNQLSVLPRILAKHPAIQNAFVEPGEKSFSNANIALHAAQIDSDSSFAFIMDMKGTTVAASNYQNAVSFVGNNYGFRPYFKVAVSNKEATFFAVGATTGEPGYFIANPITHDGQVLGVVVVKSELAGLLDSWQQPPYHWLAVDELGVVILSTSNDYLYSPTEELSAQASNLIASDRRYVPTEKERFVLHSPTKLSFQGEATNQSFLVQRQKLKAENWELQLIVERWRIWLNAIIYVLSIGSLIALASLGYRNFRAQKRLAEAEQRHALQLEAEVEQRTAELRATQQELISESNFAMLGRMSGAINHEINQPLASLRLNLATLRQLFDKPAPDMDELKQIVVDSDRTTKRIGRVVTTLRSLSGQRHAHHKKLEVAHLIDEVVETVRRERPLVSKALKVSLSDATLSLNGNDVLLQQALLNLLYNAFDATLEVSQPLVNISVSTTGESVSFKVSDNGRGVKPELQASLFKPFVSDRQKTTGLGLGLTLAELIAAEHAGRLSYLPGTPNGSHFTLDIPTQQGNTN